jgi:methionine-rich copper-binding protein CopC
VKWRAAIVALGWLFSVAPAVLAHAVLVTSTPANGATITTPSTLDATFDEELKADGSSITVRDAAGNVVATGGVRDDTLHQIVDLPALPAGQYVAHWISITADDNGKTQADITFSVSVASPAPTVAASPSPAPTPSPAASGTTTSGSMDLLIPVIVVAFVVVALGWLLLRRRRA